MIKNSTTAYGSVAKFFHWVVFVLLITMLVVGFFMDDMPKDLKPLTFNIHKLTGLTILALMCLRLGWTLMNTKPALPMPVPLWQRLAERLVHFSLYFFVILMPIVGWVGSVAAGYAPHLGGFEFNLPIEKNEAVADLAFELHEIIAFIIIGLVTVHVLAALYHQFIKRDNLIKRMW